MRLRRIRLKNYRGISECDVALPPRGVTVIVGPNEAGKTSLAEAIDLVIDYLDSSKHKEVRATQPVHVDAGAEIEVEIEAGEYAFRYYKRFHKKVETRLTVTRPRPESLTGREAHERVQAILAETVDMPLWRALRIEQGKELSLPDLTAGSTLAAALDRAAGQALADEEAESLFDAARKEYERYFTASGRPRKELKDAEAAVEEAREQLRSVRDDLARLRSAVEQSEHAARRTRELTEQIAGLETSAAEKTAAWTDLQGRAGEVASLDQASATATAKADTAEQRTSERESHIEQVAEKEGQLDDLRRKETEFLAPLSDAKEAAEAASNAVREARERVDRDRRLTELRSRDFEYRRAELDHQQLTERLDRIRDAEDLATAAEDELTSNRVDDKALRRLRDAQLEVEKARARRDTGSAHLSIEALTDVSLRTPAGQETDLKPGQPWETAVTEELELTVGEVARIHVTPSAGVGRLSDELERAEAELAGLLASLGASDIDAAVEKGEARTEATRRVRDRDRVVTENLRDLTLEDLERKVRGTGRFVDHYLLERESDLPIAESLDAARAVAKEAGEAQRTAEEDLKRATEKLEEAGSRLRGLEDRQLESRSELKVLKQEHEHAFKRLESARDSIADEALHEEAKAATAKRDSAIEKANRARQAYERSSPDLVEHAAKTAADAVKSARKELRDVEQEAIALHTRLDELGQKGLAERESELDSRLARRQHAFQTLQRRGAAALRLFQALANQRETARRAYVAPLESAMADLGRFVFGPDFAVTLDEDLRIVSRTLESRTVPFTDLSGGTREQLSMLLRLAAARTVSEDEGVPLILDDALGYSDPERLERMAAVLSHAGRELQLIVLTCMRDRYRHVADATIVRLSTDGGEPTTEED